MNFFEVNKDFHDIELDSSSLLGNDYGLSGPSFDLTDLISDDQSLCNTDYINNNDTTSGGGNSTSHGKLQDPVANSFKFSQTVDENIHQYGMTHATVSCAPGMLTQIQSKVTEVITIDSSPNVKAGEEEKKVDSGSVKVK